MSEYRNVDVKVSVTLGRLKRRPGRLGQPVARWDGVDDLGHAVGLADHRKHELDPLARGRGRGVQEREEACQGRGSR